MRHQLCITILALQFVSITCEGDTLVQPTIIDSSSGVLDTELSFDYADITDPDDLFSIVNTRLYNGIIPGPTIRVSPGDSVRVLFKNNLSLQATSVLTGDNVYHRPDHSNLHFHGGHVSGELPSDDVRLTVAPGDSYQYITQFPSNHMPGTHWIHAHLHGSTALQVGGGAAGALIVKDPEGYLPTQVEEAEDILLFFQQMNERGLQDVIEGIQDDMTKLDFKVQEKDFHLVNGQYHPILTVNPGEWQRWRIVNAGWLVETLDFAFESSSTCEMHLLAKDGIYISDYPRSVSLLPIPSGGRADVMVRCPDMDTSHSIIGFGDALLMTVSVSGAGTEVTSSDLEAWEPEYPLYLTDLTNTAVDADCACSTNLDRCEANTDKFCLNGNLFDPDRYIHTIKFGAVVERELGGYGRHPYHQHVYPFQITEGVEDISDTDSNIFWQVGDWHDTWQSEEADAIKMRFTADVHTGVLMVHCHELNHEDEGTMAQEIVLDGGECTCDADYTLAPTLSLSPSTEPSVSIAPSASPSELSSLSPSMTPSKYPSTFPSVLPSTAPSNSLAPSAFPSVISSLSPSMEQTDIPTAALSNNSTISDCDCTKTPPASKILKLLLKPN